MFLLLISFLTQGNRLAGNLQPR